MYALHLSEAINVSTLVCFCKERLHQEKKKAVNYKENTHKFWVCDANQTILAHVIV